MMSVPQTLPALFWLRVQQAPQQTALLIPHGDQVNEISWGQLAGDLAHWATALQRAGVAAGDHVVQIAENRYEWILADLALSMLGAVHVPLHASLPGGMLAEQIVDSQATRVLLSSSEQAEKLAQHLPLLVQVQQFVAYDCGNEDAGLPGLVSMQQLLAAATDFDSAAVQQQALANVQPQDLATIIYSSGTTGRPRGVMLSQANLATNAQAIVAAYNAQAEDVRLAWLPWSHIFARTGDLYTWIARGSQLAICEGREQILANCATVRPTVLNGVPYFFDKIHRQLEQVGQADNPEALKQLLGGRIRMCCSGGSALADETAEFFARQDVLLVQGYGLTETSPVICTSSREQHKIGAVGKPVAHVEIRLGDDGEIFTRGPQVMLGYWRQPAATQARIDSQGWLATGDLGQIDVDGYLTILGRKDDILATAAGHKVAPALIEQRLTQHNLIAQAIVFGTGKNYLTALLVPNPDALRSAIFANGIPVASREQALVHPRVYELYRAAIDAQLQGLAPNQQLGRFTILGQAFTPESGEMTLSLKLRRHVIAQNFAEVIDRMYQAEPAATT